MNAYTQLVEWLKNNANQGYNTYTVVSYDEIKNELGLSSSQIDGYLEMYEEEDERFVYCVFPESDYDETLYKIEYYWK